MKKQIIFVLLMSISLLAAMNTNVRIAGESQIIEFNNSNYRITEDENYSLIYADNGNVSDNSGAPGLPQFLIHISTPQNQTPNIEFNVLESELIALTKDIQPIPLPERRDGISHFNYQIDPIKYQIINNKLEIRANQNFRRVSFAEVVINPFLYNYEAKTIEVITKAELIVSVTRTRNFQGALDKFEEAFAQGLTNPQDVHIVQNRDSSVNYADFTIANHWYKIEISQNGIHSLSYNDLKDIMPVNDIDPRNLRIFATSGRKLREKSIPVGLPLDDGYPFQEIPLLVEGEEDGSFDSNDKIIFYARNRHGYDYLSNLSSRMSVNPYSDDGIYWLSYDAILDSPPLRMEQEAEASSYAVTRSNNPQNTIGRASCRERV